MMDILNIKNDDGTWSAIPAIQGPKGDKGEQGPQGEPGKDGVGKTYTFTDGLTETEGTVKWNLNPNFVIDSKANLNINHVPQYYPSVMSGEQCWSMGGANQMGGRTNATMGFQTVTEAPSLGNWIIGIGNKALSNSTNNTVVGFSNTCNSSQWSSLFGYGLDSKNLDHSTIIGEYNKTPEQETRYSLIVGNGTSSAKSNALTVNADGTGWLLTDVKIGGTDEADPTAISMKDLAARVAALEAIPNGNEVKY